MTAEGRRASELLRDRKARIGFLTARSNAIRCGGPRQYQRQPLLGNRVKLLRTLPHELLDFGSVENVFFDRQTELNQELHEVDQVFDGAGVLLLREARRDR